MLKSVSVADFKHCFSTRLIHVGEAMLPEDVAANTAIGRYGAQSMEQICGKGPLRILTHCNTGSLATAGFGTALGM